VCNWSEVDIHELARIASAVLATTGQTGLTIERMENWLRRLEFEFAPVVIQARLEGELLGWILLFIHDEKRAEINPWALNGHPFVSQEENRKEVAFRLMEQTIAYAKRRGLTRVELSFRREEAEAAEVFRKHDELYRSLGMQLMAENAVMRRALRESDFDDDRISSDYEIKSLKETDKDELYSCYHRTFSTGQDHFFFSQTNIERRAFFNQIFDLSEPFNEQTSLVLIKDLHIAGFSLVRPTHGEGNCHLWMFGVDPDHRGKGLGKSLLRLIMERSAHEGFRTMSLACELGNAAACKLYRGQGFKEELVKVEYVWKTSET
jgi:ribosomal protein S18 acetylase RimI-like enzyme